MFTEEPGRLIRLVIIALNERLKWQALNSEISNHQSKVSGVSVQVSVNRKQNAESDNSQHLQARIADT